MTMWEKPFGEKMDRRGNGASPIYNNSVEWCPLKKIMTRRDKGAPPLQGKEITFQGCLGETRHVALSRKELHVLFGFQEKFRHL